MRLYWTGNAAKTRIIEEILQSCHPPAEITVFDYGCGDAGDWPAILEENPYVRLIGYEPLQDASKRASRRLQGLKAQLCSEEALTTERFSADFVVSFSVFEHVYRRRLYLQTARRHLAPQGVLYLNYDDGHFRNVHDLKPISGATAAIRDWLRTQVASLTARCGSTSQFQRRVERSEVDALVVECGFRVTRCFYSNLGDLKRLQKTIPADLRQAYSKLWLEVEGTLNSDFVFEGAVRAGDPANLWQVMGSRTLVLRLADSLATEPPAQ